MNTPPTETSSQSPHRVVVVGGGFAGITAVKGLRHAPVEIVVIDRRNFHLFQPLTYQVATGALSPGEIAYPLRALFKTFPNVKVMLAEVSDFDLERRQVMVESPDQRHAPLSVPYDTLIVAAGSTYSYFGHDEWADFAPDVKSLESAVSVRSRILNAFEMAELAEHDSTRSAALTFVVVGGGPTGVETAGQIGELARDTLRRDFRSIDPGMARVLLVDTGERILSSFPPSLSRRASRSLERLGVTPMTSHTVIDIDAEAVTIADPEGNHQRIPARTVVWAAGVKASKLAQRLAEVGGSEVDAVGRVTVEPDLTLPGHLEVLVLGDMVRVHDAGGNTEPLPGVAPVAIQQGRYAGEHIIARLKGSTTAPFRYRDKGNLATIGRGRAVADLGFVRLSGPVAWIAWLVVHLWYLIGFQNRLLVLIRWSFSFFTHGRGSRLIDQPRGGETQP